MQDLYLKLGQTLEYEFSLWHFTPGMKTIIKDKFDKMTLELLSLLPEKITVEINLQISDDNNINDFSLNYKLLIKNPSGNTNDLIVFVESYIGDEEVIYSVYDGAKTNILGGVATSLGEFKCNLSKEKFTYYKK